MSRLTTMSPEAIKAVFSPNSDSDLFILLTIYSPTDGVTPIIRLCDGFTQRITETSEDVIYGTVSRGNNFIFIPMSITLPEEKEAQVPKCQVILQDVTRYVIPIIRNISTPPKVLLELVLSKTPNTVEASFPGFYITNVNYNASTVTFDLSMVDYEREPFPQHSFIPYYFPGLF